MSRRPELVLSLARSRFEAGELVEAALLVSNWGNEPLELPAAGPGSALRYELWWEGSAVELPRWCTSEPRSSTIAPSDYGEHILPISRWVELRPGHYSLCASLELSTGEVLSSEAVELQVFAAELVSVALTAARFAEWPKRLRVLSVRSGYEASLIREQEHYTHAEDRWEFELLPPAVRVEVPRGPLALLRTDSAERSGWVVWTDALGVHAKAGASLVQGWAELPLGGPFKAISPASVKADGSAEVYVVHGASPRLLHCRFQPPVCEEEPAGGPDDWDDERLVAGPAEARDLGEVPFLPQSATAEAGRLLLTRGSEHGLEVLLLEPGTRSNGALTFAVFEAARPLPDVEPLLRADEGGTWVATLLFGRELPVRNGQAVAMALYWGELCFRDGGLTMQRERWLGTAPAGVRSASAARSWVDGEDELVRFAVLGGDGRLLVSDEAGTLVHGSVLGELVQPLALAAHRGGSYVCIVTEAGPRLARIEQ